MAATTWRMTGIDTLASGDLELSQLRLWGSTAAIDAGTVMTCSHPPIGALENLLADDASTCRWRAADVRSPGFYIQWETPSAVEAWCVRVASPAHDASVLRYDLGYLASGRWSAARNGDLVFSAGLSPARSTAPVYDAVQGWVVAQGPLAESNGFVGADVSSDAQTMVVAARGIYGAKVSMSRDGGATWTQPAGPVAGPSGYSCAAVSADGQTVLAVGAGGAGASVSMSRDAGVTWSQPAGPVSDSFGFFGAAISANKQILAVTGIGSPSSRVSISRDGGLTWTQPAGPVSDTVGLTGVAMSGNGQIIAVVGYGSSAGKVSISRDAGLTWTQAVGPIAGSVGFVTVAMSADGQTMVVTGHGSSASQVSISHNAGLTWFQPSGLLADVQGLYGAAVSADGRTILVSGYGAPDAKVRISKDGGVTWAIVTGPVLDTLGIAGCALSDSGTVALVCGSGSSAARVSVLRGNDPAYVDAPVTTAKAQDWRLPGEVQALPQGILGVPRHRALKLLDTEFGGVGRIYGTVSKKGTPTNAVLSRRVRLHRSVDGYLARETWSKADGSYEFRELNPRYEYDVIAWDHELLEFSTVDNNQLAEVLP